MENFSLLYPSGKTPAFQTLRSEACNDLSLDKILDYITENDAEKKTLREMMVRLESSPEVIRYRCDVFEDIFRFPALRSKMQEMLEQLDYLKTIGKSFKDESVAPIWQLVNRLKELEAYADCMMGIRQALKDCDVRSEGLKKLEKYVSSVCESSGFEHLKADIDGLLTETSRIQSITLGVNLDERLCPVEVGIMSINEDKIDHTGVLDNFLGFCAKFTELINLNSGSMTRIHTAAGSAEEDPLMKNLSRAVTDMLSTTVKHLKTKLARYVNISAYSLTKFIPELLFYIRWADFCQRVTQAGLPMSRPEILNTRNSALNASEMYDIKLAISVLSGKNLHVVTNDFEFSTEHGIYIMTGPNRGGKTTFTQAVGMMFLMAQHGIYVPAKHLSLSPCDNIFTHFPADENKTVHLGRLGEEAKRINLIFSEATEQSLLLFNEPLASTSFTEGLYIAKDVVQALRCLGARTIFNTHMHELAMNLDEINAENGKLKAASLITGIRDGERSYKVLIAPPEGISYARDIAEKYGVTLHQLKQTMQQSEQSERAS